MGIANATQMMKTFGKLSLAAAMALSAMAENVLVVEENMRKLAADSKEDKRELRHRSKADRFEESFVEDEIYFLGTCQSQKYGVQKSLDQPLRGLQNASLPQPRLVQAQ